MKDCYIGLLYYTPDLVYVVQLDFPGISADPQSLRRNSQNRCAGTAPVPIANLAVDHHVTVLQPHSSAALATVVNTLDDKKLDVSGNS